MAKPAERDTRQKRKAQDTKVSIIDHPLVQHKLSIMRDRDLSTNKFRTLLHEIAMLMGYEVLRDLPLEDVEVDTPFETMRTPMLAGKKLCIVSIQRAGNALMEGMINLIPSARVGHIGLYRDPDTLVPVEYYLKMPEDLDQRSVIVVDPMLATGHSAIAAIDRVKQYEGSNIKFVCLVASPQGVDALREAHPDVHIYAASIDRELDENGYIRPGIGDAGDRMYGTK